MQQQYQKYLHKKEVEYSRSGQQQQLQQHGICKREERDECHRTHNIKWSTPEVLTTDIYKQHTHAH